MLIPLVTKRLIGKRVPKPFVYVINSFIVSFHSGIMRWTLHLVLQSSTTSSPLSFLPSLCKWHRQGNLLGTCIGNAWTVSFSLQMSFNLMWKTRFWKCNLVLYNDCISILTRIYTYTWQIAYNICHVYLYSLGHAWAVVKKIHYIMIWCKLLINLSNS